MKTKWFLTVSAIVICTSCSSQFRNRDLSKYNEVSKVSDANYNFLLAEMALKNKNFNSALKHYSNVKKLTNDNSLVVGKE